MNQATVKVIKTADGTYNPMPGCDLVVSVDGQQLGKAYIATEQLLQCNVPLAEIGDVVPQSSPVTKIEVLKYFDKSRGVVYLNESADTLADKFNACCTA